MKYQYNNFQQTMLLMLVRLQKYRSQDGGYVMVVVIIMLLILTSLLSAYMLMSRAETASTEASNNSNTGFYGAETGLNQRAKLTKEKFVGYNRPSGTSPGTPPDWKNCIDNNSTNNGSGDFACSVQTFNYKTVLNGHEKNEEQRIVSYVEDKTGNQPVTNIIPTGQPFAGLSAQEYIYDVVSAALDAKDLPTAIQGMRFKSRVVPMFQFVVFYNNDADFTIPPSMTLSGPVHSNSSLYLNAASSYTLTFNGQISTAGTLYRGEKADTTCSGTVNIFDPSTARALNCGSGRKAYSQSDVSAWNGRISIGIDRLVVPEPGEFDATPGKLYWDKADLRVVLKLNSDNNPTGIEIRNQDNTVNTTATNNLLNSCPTTSTTLQNEAAGDPNYEAGDTGLNVASSASFNAAVPNADIVTVGTDLDSNVISGVTATRITLKRQLGHAYQTTFPSAGAAVRKAVVSTSDTFYNYREKNGATGGNAGRYIRMLNVDVQGLLDCAHSQNLMGKALDDDTDGGLVWYLTVDGPNSNTNVRNASAPNTPNNYAVRLYNGKYLFSKQAGAPEIKGLTVVSDQAVYIRGDYNLKDNSATSGTNEGDDPTTTGVTERWRPAAIMADTINVLSNAWKMDDSNGRNYDLITNLPSTKIDYNLRTPTETTINAAFLSGTEVTQNGQNSGGVNNYPRFQENWNASVNFNYRGSFVSLDRPRRTNSPFCGSADATNCNIYSPPVRNWDFDSDFNNAANLPPLTPRFVYLRQENFTRSFDR